MRNVHCPKNAPEGRDSVEDSIVRQLQRSMERNARMSNRLQKLRDKVGGAWIPTTVPDAAAEMAAAQASRVHSQRRGTGMVKWLTRSALWCYLFHRWTTYWEVGATDNAGSELVKRQRCLTCGRQ